MVHQENTYCVMNGEEDKRSSNVDGGYLQELGHYDTAETTEVPGPRTEREQLGEG